MIILGNLVYYRHQDCIDWQDCSWQALKMHCWDYADLHDETIEIE